MGTSKMKPEKKHRSTAKKCAPLRMELANITQRQSKSLKWQRMLFPERYTSALRHSFLQLFKQSSQKWVKDFFQGQ